MFFQILKKDLKRKKTMNCILLLFIILSAMFTASSVNNIISVMTGLDGYMEKAGLTDVFYLTRDNEDGTSDFADRLKGLDEVTEARREDCIYITADNIKKDGKKVYDVSSCAFLQSIDNAKVNFFDKDNKLLTDIPKGKMMTTASYMRKSGLKEGDVITFDMDGTVMEFEFIGSLKDALFGSDMMSNFRFMINDSDYNEILSNDTIKKQSSGAIYYINTNDIDKTETAFSDVRGIFFTARKKAIKTTYTMDILVAAIVLIVSVCLILISFVVLRFTIKFTITEEFREIGVMKAIGLKNSSIRVLYLVKYFGIAVVGAAIGFVLSFPFGKALISSASASMVLENRSELLTALICSIAVILIIMLFGWSSTARIKKLSPIDAVRNGQTGERFSRRGIMSLAKSRLGTAPFIAANDVLSAPKQYGLITLVFTLCVLLVMILSVTANSMNSEDMTVLLSVTKSDVYISDPGRSLDMVIGKKTPAQTKAEIEQILKENGMPGRVWVEEWYKLPVEFNGKHHHTTFLRCPYTKCSDYPYIEGSAPGNAHEIALTEVAADALGAKIGDKVLVTIDGQQREFLVTALFQSFCNLGDTGRLYEGADLGSSEITSTFAFQVDFDDDPDKAEIEKRREKLADIFDCKVFDACGFVDDCTGVSGTLNDVKTYLLILALIIVILISVLMERSFISKEKSEIALQKALGFNSLDIIKTHTLRFMITSVIAVLIAAAMCIPFTRLTMDPIFAMMGTKHDIPYKINAVEMFGLIPLAVLAATAAGAFFTAIYTKTIKAQDTANIE